MLEFTYDLVPDLDAYLKRIEYTGTRELTRENLNDLVYQHQLTVPFESLDCSIFRQPADPPVNLGTPHLFEKVVEKRRGGYCFELNGLFVSMLRTFGFDAVSVYCRLMVRPVLSPVRHRGCMVRLDGKVYFCDVGYGGAMAPFAVEVTSERQTFHGETYWVEEGQEGWQILKRLRHAGMGDGGEYTDEENEVLYFAPMAFPSMDFNAYNAEMAALGSTFSDMIRANLRTVDGYINVQNYEFTEVKDRVKTVTPIAEDELIPLLKERFGLERCEYDIP